MLLTADATAQPGGYVPVVLQVGNSSTTLERSRTSLRIFKKRLA
jgi:hypothetical protein